MSNNNNQANTRHHYVQKAYLDKFAENGHIDVINRQDGTVRHGQATKDVANVRGLYTATLENGKKDGSLEGAFATEIEGPAINVINNMTSVFPYIPHGEERSLVAYYMALQYQRTPEAKRRFETSSGQLASAQMFNLAHNPDEIKRYLEQKGQDSDPGAIKKYQEMILKSIDEFEIVPSNNMWLPYIKMGMDQVAPILVERYRWHMYYYDKPSFVTSDHPVVLRKINDDHRGTGFMNADEVMFPLSKNHALILSTDLALPEGVHVVPDTKPAEMLNYFVTEGSYLEIYSPPSLSARFSKALGKRSIVEMSGGDHPELNFMKKYVGILERDRPHRH